jgi:hypothetical protein
MSQTKLRSLDLIQPDPPRWLNIGAALEFPDVSMTASAPRREGTRGEAMSEEAGCYTMSRSVVLIRSWRRRMNAELPAAYCGEQSPKAFLRRVGSEYPQPRVNEGGRRSWLQNDLFSRFSRARTPAGDAAA